MRIALLGKRFYTNQDLLNHEFGRLHHFPNEWARSHEVLVLAFDYHNGFDSNAIGRRYKLKSLGLKRPTKLLRCISATQKELTPFKPDIIVASGDILIGAVAQSVAKKLNVPWVFDIYDDYRLFPINRYTGLSFLFGSLCRNASALICASQSLAVSCGPLNRNNIVGENGFDSMVFCFRAVDDVREEYGLSGQQKMIVFTGSLDSRFDFKSVSRAMDRLVRSGFDVKFVHAGAGVFEGSERASWFCSLGNLKQDKVVRLIQSADICIAPYSNTPLALSCNPCKVSEYLACNKPVVAAAIPALERFLKNGVRLFEPGKAEGLYQALLQALETPENTSTEYALEWRAIARRCEKLMVECL